MLVGGPPRTFICDNLRSPSSAADVHAIYAAGLRMVPRPADYPEDGPVEFVINEIELGLRQKLHVIRNHHALVREVHSVIRGLGINFAASFQHCGY